MEYLNEINSTQWALNLSLFPCQRLVCYNLTTIVMGTDIWIKDQLQFNNYNTTYNLIIIQVTI